jgi:hypothetical protein
MTHEQKHMGMGLLGMIILLGLLAQGCAEADPMHVWIGRSGSELVQVWGQPSEELSQAGAGPTIVYTSHWINAFKTHTCRRLFTTSVSGVITGHSASGCSI